MDFMEMVLVMLNLKFVQINFSIFPLQTFSFHLFLTKTEKKLVNSEKNCLYLYFNAASRLFHST